MKTYKNKDYLKKMYKKLGSTRKVGRHFNVSNATIVNWMRRFHIPRIPQMNLYDNNSGKGRMAELNILGHPYFRKHMTDLGVIDDKSKIDVLWHGDRVNIKCCHSKRFTFRVKKKRHDVSWYICCCYDDSIDPLIPIEVFIIPAKVAPHSGIGVSITKKDGKYYRYKLSHKRGLDFSAEDEEKYNKWFKKKYSKVIQKRK
ncbi:MAG: hypothetical protein Q8P26_00665 [Candidatus Levybacteria bacterium]|nr:hypothetical protein [Candidatus Levybacteria bacterium]